MVPKLDDNGDQISTKVGKRPNGKEYSEERKMLETFYEYYVENVPEVENFINMFAINADSFDYKKYFVEEKAATPSSIVTV